MRIGIIAHLKYPIAEPFAGGLEMHTHLLASKLKERGNEVVVFAADGSSVTGAVGVCGATAPLSSSKADWLASSVKEHSAYLAIINQLKNANFDVIHNNSLHHLPLMMAQSVKSPMLTTLHTPPFDPFDKAVLCAAEGHHKFVAVSEAVAAQWSSLTKIRDVVPNGVDLSRFLYHPKPRAPAYCVWYGRIVPEKGLHYAIDAARAAGMPLRFAGPMLDLDYFNRFIAKRLADDTIYEGHLAHANLSRLIGGASVFLCTPCWEEPYGLVVAEALASGVPVASFARGAIPQIIDASSGVLAGPDDAFALASAVRKALTLSRADCRSRAQKICDAELMVDRYVDLYTTMSAPAQHFDLLALPSAPPPASTDV